MPSTKQQKSEDEIIIDHGEGYQASAGMTYMTKVAHRVVEHAMAFMFLKRAFDYQWSFLSLFMGFLAGNLLADVISVIVHFTLDNYFSPETPIVGSTVHYFREHHNHPARMVGKSFIDTNSEICVAGLLICPLSYAIQCMGYLNSSFGNAMLGSCAFLCTIINTIHCYTHMPLSKTPWFYRFFAITIPFFVHPEHHKMHHKVLNSHYSLYMGKMDQLFDFFYILEASEIIIYIVTGLLPEAGRAHKWITMEKEIGFSERVTLVFRDLFSAREMQTEAAR